MFYFFFLAIGLSTLFSLILTPLVRNFFCARHWIEDPLKKQQKSHNATALKSVPRGGGIPVFISILVTSLLFLPLDKHLIGILLASFLTLVVGVADDLFDISPHFRLLTNFLAALIIVISGIGIAYLSNPMGSVIDLSQFRFTLNFLGGIHSVWIVADLLAVFWIMWLMNIIGWSAGVDGQLPGIVAISAFFVGLIGLRFSDYSQWPVVILAGALSGAYFGFMPYNFYPQSVMPGYSGKSLAGLLLAVLSILSGAKLASLMFLLGVPMVDAVFVIFRRLLHKRSPFYSDGNHLHHQLLKIGWSRPRIALFYWSITLVFGLISTFLNSAQKLYFFVGISLLIVSLIIFVSRRTLQTPSRS
ncbi:MAG TPA: MraY family glycosyltransferase [Patescibacteria group bacterium]